MRKGFDYYETKATKAGYKLMWDFLDSMRGKGLYLFNQDMKVEAAFLNKSGFVKWAKESF